MAKQTAGKAVYLLYTRGVRFLPSPELLAVYSEASYQAAYDRLTAIAERHGERVFPGDTGSRILAQTAGGEGQWWWLERWDLL